MKNETRKQIAAIVAAALMTTTVFTGCKKKVDDVNLNSGGNTSQDVNGGSHSSETSTPPETSDATSSSDVETSGVNTSDDRTPFEELESDDYDSGVTSEVVDDIKNKYPDLTLDDDDPSQNDNQGGGSEGSKGSEESEGSAGSSSGGSNDNSGLGSSSNSGSGSGSTTGNSVDDPSNKEDDPAQPSGGDANDYSAAKEEASKYSTQGRIPGNIGSEPIPYYLVQKGDYFIGKNGRTYPIPDQLVGEADCDAIRIWSIQDYNRKHPETDLDPLPDDLWDILVSD